MPTMGFHTKYGKFAKNQKGAKDGLVIINFISDDIIMICIKKGYEKIERPLDYDVQVYSKDITLVTTAIKLKIDQRNIKSISVYINASTENKEQVINALNSMNIDIEIIENSNFIKSVL